MFLFVLGIAADMVFILSDLSRFLRLMPLILYWSGLTLLIAAANSVCVFLYTRNSRQLPSWEQAEYYGGSAGSAGDTNEKEVEISQDCSRSQSWWKSRGLSRASPGRTIDPLRKGSMQVFGEANKWEREAREGYENKPYLHKILDDTVTTQSRAIRLLQDRVVLLLVCWAGIISIVLTVGLLFVPEARLF